MNVISERSNKKKNRKKNIISDRDVGIEIEAGSGNSFRLEHNVFPKKKMENVSSFSGKHMTMIVSSADVPVDVNSLLQQRDRDSKNRKFEKRKRKDIMMPDSDKRSINSSKIGLSEIRRLKETRTWSRFLPVPVGKSLNAPVTSIDFATNATSAGQYQRSFLGGDDVGENYVVTSGMRVVLFDARTNLVKRNLIQSNDGILFSGRIRSDGKLLIVGSDQGHVKIVNASQGSGGTLLRNFTQSHKGATRVTRWSTQHSSYALSGSDDRTLRLWDITGEEELNTFEGHTDYIRSACSLATENVSASETWASGSYDHTIRIWDPRYKHNVSLFDHGAPVEDVLMMPGNGSILLSAGGIHVKLWDIRKPSLPLNDSLNNETNRKLMREPTDDEEAHTLDFSDLETPPDIESLSSLSREPLHEFSNHQKTVTSLRLSADKTRFFTGGLDSLVKVYSLETFEVIHSFKMQGPVLSLAISPFDSRIVAGSPEGKIMIRAKNGGKPSVSGFTAPLPRPRGGTHRYFVRGRDSKPSSSDFSVLKKKASRLHPYEKLLNKFQFKEALDASMKSRQPAVVVSVLEELMHRGKPLEEALKGRDDESLEPLLSFLVKFCTDPRYSGFLLRVCEKMLEIYGEDIGSSPIVDNLLVRMQQRVSTELGFQKDLLKLDGTIQLLLHSQSSSS